MNHEKSPLSTRTPMRAGVIALGAAVAIGTVVALASWHARAAGGAAGPALLAQGPTTTEKIGAKIGAIEILLATVPSAAEVIDRAPEPGEPAPSF